MSRPRERGRPGRPRGPEARAPGLPHSPGLLLAAIGGALILACTPAAPPRGEAPPAPTATVRPPEAPVPTTTPPPTSTPTPTATPTPTPVPAQPQIQTPAGEERQFIRQGEGLLVWLPADTPDAPAVTYQGQRVSLVAAGSRWLGILGVPPWAAPGPASVAISRAGQRIELPLPVRVTEFPEQRITLPPAVAPLSAPAVLNDEQAVLDRRVFALRSPSLLWQGPFRQPVAAEPPTPFGLRRVFNGQPTGHHLGVDYDADAGAPVAAANSGRVALAERLDVRGNAVILDHGGGLFSGYYHLSQMAVAQGQEVAKGQRLGLVGSTGLATGPHLHWEMRVGSNPVDPLPWLAAVLP